MKNNKHKFHESQKIFYIEPHTTLDTNQQQHTNNNNNNNRNNGRFNNSNNYRNQGKNNNTDPNNKYCKSCRIIGHTLEECSAKKICCSFHNSVTHSTEECYSLKRLRQDAQNLPSNNNLFKNFQPNNHNSSNSRNFQSGPPNYSNNQPNSNSNSEHSNNQTQNFNLDNTNYENADQKYCSFCKVYNHSLDECWSKPSVYCAYHKSRSHSTENCKKLQEKHHYPH